MNNTQFLQSIGVTQPETLQKCLATMEKYGDNHWWEPDTDPRKFAYYQLHESVELLLGRPVWTHEFGINADGLRQEAERAWTYQVGVTSEAERDERVQASIKLLTDYAEKTGKQIIQVNVDGIKEA